MVLELLTNPQVAVSRDSRVDPRFDEPLGRQVAVRLEPIEHGIDLFDGVLFVGFARFVGVGGARALGARLPQQLAPQLDPALLALRQPLQRARLQRTSLRTGSRHRERVSRSQVRPC